MSRSVTTELTKQLLADSLLKLMKEKPLNKISIREIVADCGVNRQTFYYHFQDIYDLLEWILNKEIISVIENADNFLTWQDAGIYLLRYLQENSTVVLCALNSMSRSAIKNLIFSDVLNIASQFITQVAEGIEVNQEDFDHVVHYYAVSLSALLEDWLSSGMKDSPEDLIGLLDTMVSGSARMALERFAAKENRK